MNSSHKKILIVTQKVDYHDQLLGFFIEWLKRFAKYFDTVTVVCLERGVYDLPSNVNVLSLGKDSGRGKIYQLARFYYVIYSLRDDYDVVLVHMNPIWVVLGASLWRAMTKKVFLWYTHKAVTMKLRLATRWAHGIFTASQESFRLASDKVMVTGHGIDTDFFKPDAIKKHRDGLLRLLSVGRIAPVKNYATLVEAAVILRDRGIQFVVDIIGEPALQMDYEYYKKLRHKIMECGLENSFNFIGKVDHNELVPYYQSHDIFVHLSKTGSVDKTSLEAMACGLTIVSCNDAARAYLPPELVFAQGDAEELARKITQAMHCDYGDMLRYYVIEHHNLDRLIAKIAQKMLAT